MKERDFQRWLKELAQATGWLYYHCQDSRKNPRGFLDTVLLRRDRLIMAELKVGKNKLTSEQREWYQTLALVPGIEVYVWYPEDRDEIEKILKGG